VLIDSRFVPWNFVFRNTGIYWFLLIFVGSIYASYTVGTNGYRKYSNLRKIRYNLRLIL